MPRILGVDIPDDKRLEYSLRYIYGIGPTKARKVVDEMNLDPAKKARELDDSELTALAKNLRENYAVEGDLRRQNAQNIRRLISIGCYRGQRHRKGLPVRGQRTQTNARTRKGPRKTVGVVRGKEARADVKSKV